MLAAFRQPSAPRIMTERVRNRRAKPFIKQATGNDKLTARFLYGEHFNFLPTFKIFMASNHKPVSRGRITASGGGSSWSPSPR